VQNSDKGHIVQNLNFIHQKIKDNEDMRKAIEIILGYTKSLSVFNENNILKYYDEMEWRIVHTDQMVKRGYITEYKKGKFSIKIQAKDIKIIIFPNKETQELFIKDVFLIEFFKNNFPTAVLLNNCENF
jgi:hypothetical protein